MGVFACGWLGLMFALLPVFVWVFALSWCWRFGGVVGQCGPAAPHYAHCPLEAWAFGAHALVWALLACAGCCVPDGRRGGQVGAGQSCPAPTCVAWATSVAPWRGRERRGVWGAPGVLTHAHAQRERERERGGEGRGASRGGPWSGRGLWVVARWVVTRVGGDKCPKPGESKNLTLLGRGRGVLPAVVGFWQWGRVVVAGSGGGAPSFGCVAWCWGRGAFPLVVGLGWWWRFPLGSVKGGGGG